MVQQDLGLAAFWYALLICCVSGGLLLLWVYRLTQDVVAGMSGLSGLWLGFAFGINGFLRCFGPASDVQHMMVHWQRACFGVAVICFLLGADAVVRAHNGNVPSIRRFVRWWERWTI